MVPKITELLSAELEREAATTRRLLERVPEGRNDWKPHEKSMLLGYLAALVAAMPGWIKSILEHDELDIADPGEHRAREWSTHRDLLEAFDAAVERGREALAAVDDELLMTPWKMLARGQVVSEKSRYEAIREDVINHFAHHRGQLTVYLRLNDAPVSSIYGPTADEKVF